MEEREEPDGDHGIMCASRQQIEKVADRILRPYVPLGIIRKGEGSDVSFDVALKGNTSRFVHLEKFSLKISSLLFAICVNLHHPCSFSFILTSLLLIYLGKLLFKGFLPLNTNFQRPKKQLRIS